MAELSQHRLIGFDRDNRSFRPMAEEITRDMFCFRCGSDLAQLAALRAGLGIGCCQVKLAARTPDLAPVLAKTVQFGLEMWIAMHEDLKSTRRVRPLFDHLATGLRGFLRQGEQDGVGPKPVSSPLDSD